MKSSEYWEKRHIALFDELYDETQARLVKYYKTALRETENDIIKLYAYLLEHSESKNLIAND